MTRNAWMRLLVLSLSMLAASAAASAQEQASLDRVLNLAREHGYRAAHVEWAAVETEARSLAETRGEDAAIRYVLESLGDGHSSYRPPVPPLSEIRAPVEGVPVIRINRWSGKGQAASKATKTLRSHLAEVLEEPRCGVILDFSDNSGGNMWPMLVGLGPLLTEGALGAFRDAHGKATVIEKKAGLIFVGGSGHRLDDPALRRPAYPAPSIALIIGPRTASSGEIVPIMFRGQNNVRSFGQRTSGHATANSTFLLPNGGAVNITSAATVDRLGTVHEDSIEPDIATDRPIQDAARWIAGECKAK